MILICSVVDSCWDLGSLSVLAQHLLMPSSLLPLNGGLELLASITLVRHSSTCSLENGELISYAVFYTGSILSTGVAYASSKASGELAFRLPLALQLIPPTCILAGLSFVPESPRWLTARGKTEQAAKILAKYHGGGDINHPVVQMELREFEEGIQIKKAQSWWNYYDL